jgi:hypothetical protein
LDRSFEQQKVELGETVESRSKLEERLEKLVEGYEKLKEESEKA